MKRREFIGVLAGIATSWPSAIQGQQTIPTVGYLGSTSPDEPRHAAFRQGLSEQGYVEGRNVAIEFLWAHSQYDRLPALVAEFQRRRLNVLFASGNQAANAAKAANISTPIVFSVGDDPVQAGLVKSMSRPPENITGVTFYSVQLVGKRLGLLHELTARDAKFALLVNPSTLHYKTHLTEAQKAAKALGRQIAIFTTGTASELEQAFHEIARSGAGGFVYSTDPFFNAERHRLAALAVQYRLPGIYSGREYALAGGLVSYGASIPDSHRQAGSYVGRLLRGESPADLPVTLPTKFDLVLNLKTAKTLGVVFPSTMLALADEVIE